MKLFDYQLVVFYDDPIREEAINVAVIVLDEHQARFAMNFNRIRIPEFEEAAIATFKDYLSTVQLRAGRDNKLKTLEKFHQAVNGQIQFKSVRTYQAESTEQALEKLYDRYIS